MIIYYRFFSHFVGQFYLYHLRHLRHITCTLIYSITNDLTESLLVRRPIYLNISQWTRCPLVIFNNLLTSQSDRSVILPITILTFVFVIESIMQLYIIFSHHQLYTNWLVTNQIEIDCLRSSHWLYVNCVLCCCVLFTPAFSECISNYIPFLPFVTWFPIAFCWIRFFFLI